ncbi:hypothetical protein BH10BAC4_BH10BAC4_13430 [soil metagenome]
MAAGTAIAQPYPSRLGRFQVDQKKGCAPFTITLTNLLAGDCTPGKPCIMTYEGAVQQQNQFTHTYTTPGTYKLSVLYQSIGVDDITITVVANVQPNFEIYSCSGNNAEIKVVDNNYEQYIIDFDNDGTPEATLPFTNNISTPPHNYAPPGTYTASVRGRNTGSADNCTAKTQPFTSLASLPTATISTLTSIDATSLKLDFTTAPNVLYRLEIASNNSTSFQLLQLVYQLSTLTLTNLKLDENFYCFRLSAFDVCAGSATTFSNIVCSDKFSVTAQSEVNQLLFPTANLGAVAVFNIVRVDGSNSTSIPIHTTTYSDLAIVCKTQYCYRITTNYIDGSKSISLEKCVTAISTKIPTAVSDISSVVPASGAGVDLTWLQDPAFIPKSYTVQQSSSGDPYAFLSSTPTAKFTDVDYTTSGKLCYRVNYTDNCDNISAQSIAACPIRLNGTIDKKNAITLLWNSPKGWKNGVKNYTIEKYNLQGGLIATVTATDSTFVDDQTDLTNQLVRYIIKANPNDASPPISISNSIEFVKNANLYYPTAFTPNNDNLNDQFSVSGQYISRISLRVFDRWGALVYATDKNEAWNGTREGKAMPAGTYAWKVEITDLAGRTFTKEGIVALMLN